MRERDKKRSHGKNCERSLVGIVEVLHFLEEKRGCHFWLKIMNNSSSFVLSFLQLFSDRQRSALPDPPVSSPIPIGKKTT